MKKIALVSAFVMVAGAAMAQSHMIKVHDFSRPMPCLNNRGEVIATEMGTICLPYAPQVEGATLYELVSASSTEFIFQEVTDPQANTPYVFRVNDGVAKITFAGDGEYQYTNNDITTSAAGVADAFVGSYSTHVVNEPLYFLNGDQIRYTDQPVYSTRFRAYFKASILPEGTVLSPNVRMTFCKPGTAALYQMGQTEAEAVSISRQNIGLQQGTYQLGGRKVEVK